MTQTLRIEVHDADRLAAIRSFLAAVMQKNGIDAMLVPARVPLKNRIMPTLVSNPALLSEADPLSPAFPLNAAQQLTRLTRTSAGGRLAAVLRPCEIRAFNELVKLNQGRREDVLLIGIDCPGAFSNDDFRDFADRYDTPDDATHAFVASAFDDGSADGRPPFTGACRACVHPLPDTADIAIDLFGLAAEADLTVRAATDSGAEMLQALALPPAEDAEKIREAAVAEVAAARAQQRERMLSRVAAATDSIAALGAYLGDCVSCYNCRSACPVCYCTTCVFATDTFRHEPFQYLRWTQRKGSVKMPTDTLFFHLTRMVHISCACVGCGQCTNACPNDIPLSDLFTHVAAHAQEVFGYAAGRDLAVPPPMSRFEQDEYGEIVGL